MFARVLGGEVQALLISPRSPRAPQKMMPFHPFPLFKALLVTCQQSPVGPHLAQLTKMGAADSMLQLLLAPEQARPPLQRLDVLVETEAPGPPVPMDLIKPAAVKPVGEVWIFTHLLVGVVSPIASRVRFFCRRAAASRKDCKSELKWLIPLPATTSTGRAADCGGGAAAAPRHLQQPCVRAAARTGRAQHAPGALAAAALDGWRLGGRGGSGRSPSGEPPCGPGPGQSDPPEYGAVPGWGPAHHCPRQQGGRGRGTAARRQLRSPQAVLPAARDRHLSGRGRNGAGRDYRGAASG